MNQVFSTVQYIRELVRDKYNFAMGTYRWTWLDKPNGQDQAAVLKLNIFLNNLFSGGKRDRLEKFETLATVLGWNNGTTTDSLWGAYEDLKKKLRKDMPRQKGLADRAYREIEKDARKVWGLASTKDLWLAEIYALIEAMEEEPDTLGAIEAIARNPRMWVQKLARLKPVKRPSAAMFIPPPVPEEEVVEPVKEVSAWTEEIPW
jgi:hypothetical protein